MQGWDYKVEKRTLDEPIEAGSGDAGDRGRVEDHVVGRHIKPGRVQEFPVSLGPLPEDVESLSFPAMQTYEGGEVVRWIDIPEEGAEEPEHPAPTLTLLPAEEEAAAAPADGGRGRGRRPRGEATAARMAWPSSRWSSASSAWPWAGSPWSRAAAAARRSASKD